MRECELCLTLCFFLNIHISSSHLQSHVQAKSVPTLCLSVVGASESVLLQENVSWTSRFFCVMIFQVDVHSANTEQLVWLWSDRHLHHMKQYYSSLNIRQRETHMFSWVFGVFFVEWDVEDVSIWSVKGTSAWSGKVKLWWRALCFMQLSLNQINDFAMDQVKSIIPFSIFVRQHILKYLNVGCHRVIR